MKLGESYILSKDIDWFCNIDGIYIHAASAGGELPDVVNDRKMLREVQLAVSKLQDIYEEDQVVFNEEVIRKRLRDNFERLAEHGIENYWCPIKLFLENKKLGLVPFGGISPFWLFWFYHKLL